MTKNAKPEHSTRRSPGPTKRTRRRRGEPRRLLLESARDLFSRQGYSNTSTREIADHAQVSETLLFRNFGSKAGLFREALVAPFIEYIEDLNERWRSGAFEGVTGEEFTRLLIGDLFDLFRKHRGLVVMLWAADGYSEEELAETGVNEIADELNVLVRLGSKETIERGHPTLPRHDLATRSMLAMVAGMAVFGSTFYGKRQPSRAETVEELTQAVLHGRLHRPH